MSFRTQSAGFLIGVALLLCACMPVTSGRDKPYLAGNQPSYPTLGAALPSGHTRYSNQSLADLFVRLTHDLEWGGRRPNLVRYEAPVSVGISGPGALQYTGFLDAYLGQIRAQTGIQISRTASPHNLSVRFIPGPEFRSRVPRHFCVVAPGRLDWETFRKDPVAHGTRAYERSRVQEAMTVFIPDNAEPYLARICLIEEIAQALGTANDLYGLGPSIFNDDAAHVWPTRLDFLMLRVLYQPEMRTGLNRRETRARARAVLDRINPQGIGAPPLPVLAPKEMSDWAEEIRSAFERGSSQASRVSAARRAMEIAKRRHPFSAYHCRSLRALARTLRSEPQRSLDILSQANTVCARAHGADDIRLTLIALDTARAQFKAGRFDAAVNLAEGLESALAAHGLDERLVALYDLRAAGLQAIQQGTRSFEARRRAGEWGAYALGRDHADVRRLLGQ